MPSIKWLYFPRTRLRWRLPNTEEPPGVAAGGLGVCRARLRGGATVGWQVVKPCSPMAIEVGERFDTDQAWV
jgi:hypothetical protein